MAAACAAVVSVQRYRVPRHKALVTYRQKAVEAPLRSIDMVGIAPGFEDEAEYYRLQNALRWRLDSTEIDARLAAYSDAAIIVPQSP